MAEAGDVERTPQATTGPPADERVVGVGPVARVLQRPEIGALAGALAVFALFTSTATTFATLDGAAVWLDVAANFGIMAVPVALLMIGGEFDLSAGVMVGSTGLVLGLLVTELDLNVWPAIALTLLFGAAIGLTNGVMVIWTGLPSFIVTLGTFFILQGVNLGVTTVITGTVRVADIDLGDGFESASKLFASTFWAPHNFTVAVVWWLALTAVGTWLLTRTRFGNWIYAAGGNAVAARSVGVPVAFTKIALFTMTSTTAALLGVMTALTLRSVQAGQGIGNEFRYIIAAVVGGCLLTGGYGSVIGASVGALIMGMAEIGIPFSGWNSDWRFLFLGIILVLAVLLNTTIRRRAEEARRR
ncbi:MAG TPA: ABC transporter permease [Gaiellaceae bacterium]|nr:ABC transporter permease [Gaiellaceae bacterium]